MESERNMRFFQKALIQHCQNNMIYSLKDKARNRLVQHEEMEELVVNHFQSLLGEPTQDRLEAI